MGKRVDAPASRERSDALSLGRYVPAFVGDTIGAVSIALAKGQFIAGSRHRDGLGRGLDAWFDRALHTDIDARFQGAGEMVRADGPRGTEDTRPAKAVPGAANETTTPQAATGSVPPQPHGRGAGVASAIIAFASAVLLVAACSSSDSALAPDAGNGADAGTAGSAGVGGAASNDDGSEVQSSVDHPRSIELVSEFDVTPAGQQAHRPDVVVVGSELWLAYGTSTDGLALQRFDLDLVPIGDSLPIEDATEMPTDVRVGLARGRFWYAYETVAPPLVDCTRNFLSVAAYSDAEPPTLVASARHIATGCPTTVEFVLNPSGLPAAPEAVDDPTPFFHGGARYVLTRAWPEATAQLHHLRRLDGALAVADEELLDTGSLVSGGAMGQNTLFHIDGRPFVAAGFPSGPPAPPSTSTLYLLELRDDLGGFVGSAIELAVPSAIYPQRITRARHVNGTLILNYVDRYEGLETRELIALFDIASGYELTSELEVQDHEVVDNHSSFEVVDDRLYLFQQRDGEQLSAKIFRLVP